MEEKKKNKIPGWVILVVVCSVVFFVLPFFILFGVGLYLGFSEDGPAIVEENNTIIIDDALKIDKSTLNSFYDLDTKSYYVTGELKEMGKQEEYGYVEVFFNVYDKNDKILGVAMAYIDNLKKEQTWKFKAAYSNIDANDVYRYEFESVNYYDF